MDPDMGFVELTSWASVQLWQLVSSKNMLEWHIEMALETDLFFNVI